MEWLNSKRLTVYPRIILILYILIGGYFVLLPGLLGHGLVDKLGKPIGTDFAVFWTASKVALAGEPASVYDLSTLQAAQRNLIGADFPLGWFYPPTFLLIILPLSYLPYLISLLTWNIITLSGYLLTIRRIAPHPSTVWLALSFPGTFQNFFHGQNGFLSASLIGCGLLFLDSYPVIGGLILGFVTYKPQLAALIPLALIAGRRWQALLAFSVSSLNLALISLLMFGPKVWEAFLQNISLPMKLVSLGILPGQKMATVYSATLLLGGNLRLAAFLQAAVMTLVAVLVIWTWAQKGLPLSQRASILIIGILLFTPFTFEYDLTLLALPLAWLAWENYHKNLKLWMLGLLFLGWLMPIAAPLLAKITCLQVGPIILAALIFLTLHLTYLKTNFKNTQ
jgi:hypothetical protein